MKKFLKYAFILLGVLILIGAIAYFMNNEARPEGKQGPEAEALAQKMSQAIDIAAWDSTKWITWDFVGRNQYVWDKERHLVEVTTKGSRVLLNPNEISGKAFVNGKEVEGDEAYKLVRAAWSNFCNDSFWLNAPSKINDPGTNRSIVDLEDGSKGLMITYASGGVTPGDSYLWILDADGLPKSYKMWVSIIPLGGVEFTWENWTTLSSGAKISTLHKGLLEIPITDLKSGKSYQEIGLSEDIFAGM